MGLDHMEHGSARKTLEIIPPSYRHEALNSILNYLAIL